MRLKRGQKNWRKRRRKKKAFALALMRYLDTFHQMMRSIFLWESLMPKQEIKKFSGSNGLSKQLQIDVGAVVSQEQLQKWLLSIINLKPTVMEDGEWFQMIKPEPLGTTFSLEDDVWTKRYFSSLPEGIIVTVDQPID